MYPRTPAGVTALQPLSFSTPVFCQGSHRLSQQHLLHYTDSSQYLFFWFQKPLIGFGLAASNQVPSGCSLAKLEIVTDWLVAADWLVPIHQIASVCRGDCCFRDNYHAPNRRRQVGLYGYAWMMLMVVGQSLAAASHNETPD